MMLLYEKGSLPLKAITTELGLPLSTCYNIVSTLESRGVLEKDSHTNHYMLGITLMKWGFKAYNEIDIRKHAIGYLHKLVDIFNETAAVSIFNKPSYESVVVDVVEGHQILRTSPKIGSRYPLHKTGAGKCFLTSLSSQELKQYFMHVATELNPTAQTKLATELQEIRQNGYAVTVNELGNNAASVGAGIRDEQAEIIAAISLSGPSERIIKQFTAMKETVKRFSDEISLQLYGKRFN